MTRRALRLAALVAVISAFAVVLGSASVASFEPSESESLGQLARRSTEPSTPPDDPAPPDLQPVVPVSPGSTLDCYPIGKVRPAKPEAIPLPEAAPDLPGPVPIPRVRITCAPEQAPPLLPDALKRLKPAP